MKRLLSILLALCICIACVSVFAVAGYSDLSSYHWAKDTIERYTNAGIFNGFPDGTFRPDERMTRAQFASVLSRLLSLENADLSVLAPFTDVNPDAWYAQALASCVKAAIINGTSHVTASPDASITRQEAAAMVCRAFGVDPIYDTVLEFLDADTVSPWAQPYVFALVSKGILSGYPDKTLKPRGFLTRAEAAALVSKAEILKPAAKTYSLNVSVVGFGDEGANSTISRTLSSLSPDCRISDLLTDTALKNRTQLWKLYASGGLKDVMVNALRAFAAGGDTWQVYAGRMAYAVGGSVSFKQACIDNAPISSLIEGMPYTLEFLGYRLTVTLYSE